MTVKPPADRDSPDAGVTGFSAQSLHEDAAKLLESLRDASTDASLDDDGDSTEVVSIEAGMPALEAVATDAADVEVLSGPED